MREVQSQIALMDSWSDKLRSDKLRTYKGRILYRPTGRAGEYGELALNLFTTCPFGCVYCYVPSVLEKSRADFVRHGPPRAGLLSALRRDLAELGPGPEQVFMCFTCDPYQPAGVESGITRAAIETIHHHGRGVRILTKAGVAAVRDLDLFGPADAFGVSLTTLDRAVSARWERNAAPPEDRIEAMTRFHKAGISTWVSLEPVIDPQATLEIIRATYRVVDEYKLGPINYSPLAKSVDWRSFAYEAKDLLEGLGCRYYFKQDLRKHL